MCKDGEEDGEERGSRMGLKDGLKLTDTATTCSWMCIT